MMLSAAASLAEVTNEHVAAVWVNIYGRLSNRDVVNGMLICKAFKQLLSP